MYVVIVGAGRVGALVAKWLVSSDHEVAVVDRLSSRCDQLDSELGNVSVVGDATEVGVLAKAGASRADVFMATTGSDEDNLMACQLAKQRFGVGRTVSLVSVPEHERLFDRVGIDLCVNTTTLTVARIQDTLHESLAHEQVSEG